MQKRNKENMAKYLAKYPDSAHSEPNTIENRVGPNIMIIIKGIVAIKKSPLKVFKNKL